ncbi:arrestin domain-containing protein 2 [Megalopta genalis]|uniref:arrestin domain-containing protein 2 n=1 Tax=Megalopta genalis TaxID=115081 RepID=UPI003FCF1727
MPSLRTFTIELDRPGAVYQVGESVTGNIIVNTSEEKSVRGLYFIAKGAASVYWTESSSSTDSDGKSTSTSDSYSASEHYFTIKGNVLGSSESDSRVEIKEGYHQYPFMFQLPCNIPSSFENFYGNIRYTVKAVIDRPWKFDHECKVAFTVISVLDLNANRDKCLGIYDEAQKNLYCCCCRLGSMNVTIRIPSSGYVPGQLINTSMNFGTASSQVPVSKISTKLERVTRFHATTKSRTENFEISSSSYSGPFSTHTVANLEIRVPPTPPSNLSFCRIIDMDYYLKVIVHFPGAHVNVQRRYPLLIGSIPLYVAPSAPHESPSIAKESVAPMPMPLPDAPQPGVSNTQAPHVGFIVPDQTGTSTNWDIPPPSYEECVSGAQHIKDQDESDYVHGANSPFSPRYPVFNYPTPSAPSK